MDEPHRSATRSLSADKHAYVQARILRAAMDVVAKRGLRSTVGEIAQLSGVSPRTIHRYFASHDRLIIAAVEGMFEACGHPIEDAPSPIEDVHRWLEVLALTIHTRNAEILGEAFWTSMRPAVMSRGRSQDWPRFRVIIDSAACATLRRSHGSRQEAWARLRRIWCRRSRSTSRPSPRTPFWSTSISHQGRSRHLPPPCSTHILCRFDPWRNRSQLTGCRHSPHCPVRCHCR